MPSSGVNFFPCTPTPDCGPRTADRRTADRRTGASAESVVKVAMDIAAAVVARGARARVRRARLLTRRRSIARFIGAKKKFIGRLKGDAMKC